jgi:hypothetical protein
LPVHVIDGGAADSGTTDVDACMTGFAATAAARAGGDNAAATPDANSTATANDRSSLARLRIIKSFPNVQPIHPESQCRPENWLGACAHAD